MGAGKQKLWDERTGRRLAEFFNNIRADSLVVEMGAEEGRKLSTSDLIVLLQVRFCQAFLPTQNKL